MILRRLRSSRQSGSQCCRSCHLVQRIALWSEIEELNELWTKVEATKAVEPKKMAKIHIRRRVVLQSSLEIDHHHDATLEPFELCSILFPQLGICLLAGAVDEVVPALSYHLQQQ